MVCFIFGQTLVVSALEGECHGHMLLQECRLGFELSLGFFLLKFDTTTMIVFCCSLEQSQLVVRAHVLFCRV